MDYKNMFSLEGRKAVITGGCGYLGREIVKGSMSSTIKSLRSRISANPRASTISPAT